jgi:hypothetical protein
MARVRVAIFLKLRIWKPWICFAGKIVILRHTTIQGVSFVAEPMNHIFGVPEFVAFLAIVYGIVI